MEQFSCSCELHHPMTQDDWDKIIDVDMDNIPSVKFHTKHGKEVEYVKVIRCRDCRHFSVKDHWGNVNGVPILCASDMPTCDAWANTECMVDPDGYCFLGERKEGIEDGAGKA